MKSFSIKRSNSHTFTSEKADAFYHILVFEGKGLLTVDYTEFDFSGKTILFTSPYQQIKIYFEKIFPIEELIFHGDFYCIEYHKKEVACNGLLFNNIYLFPHISPDDFTFAEVLSIFKKIENINPKEEFSTAILRSYLQLILALCSKIKNEKLKQENFVLNDDNNFDYQQFRDLIEKYFSQERSPAFYAQKLHIAANTFSKKIKKHFGKTPGNLINERVILEAKKLLHLTHKNINEIAFELNFADEFYFSKYFKKHTGASPSAFRKEVGISVVADLSMK